MPAFLLSSAYWPVHVFNYFESVERFRLLIQLCIFRWVFIVSFESISNIQSHHLNLLSLNRGEQDTPPIAIHGKVLIELDDQLCVGGGGDRLEELL